MYATIQDMRGFLPQIQISQSSRPTEDEVGELLEGYSQELDSILVSLGYTTPLNEDLSPISLRMAKQMVKERTAVDVLRIQYAGLRDADSLGAKAFESSWNAKLKRLQDPTDPFTFTDAVYTNRQEKMDVVAASMVSEEPEFYEEPRITRDTIF